MNTLQKENEVLLKLYTRLKNGEFRQAFMTELSGEKRLAYFVELIAKYSATTGQNAREILWNEACIDLVLDVAAEIIIDLSNCGIDKIRIQHHIRILMIQIHTTKSRMMLYEFFCQYYGGKIKQAYGLSIDEVLVNDYSKIETISYSDVKIKGEPIDAILNTNYLFDKFLIDKLDKKLEYFIGVDTLDKNAAVYCFGRIVDGVFEVLLSNRIADINKFENEVQTLARLFKAKILK